MATHEQVVGQRRTEGQHRFRDRGRAACDRAGSAAARAARTLTVPDRSWRAGRGNRPQPRRCPFRDRADTGRPRRNPEGSAFGPPHPAPPADRQPRDRGCEVRRDDHDRLEGQRPDQTRPADDICRRIARSRRQVAVVPDLFTRRALRHRRTAGSPMAGKPIQLRHPDHGTIGPMSRAGNIRGRDSVTPRVREIMARSAMASVPATRRTGRSARAADHTRHAACAAMSDCIRHVGITWYRHSKPGHRGTASKARAMPAKPVDHDTGGKPGRGGKATAGPFRLSENCHNPDAISRRAFRRSARPRCGTGVRSQGHVQQCK